MDPLRRDDLDRARRSTPEERLAQTFEMMRTGGRLKRIALRLRHPQASEEELDDRLKRWLARDDGA